MFLNFKLEIEEYSWFLVKCYRTSFCLTQLKSTYELRIHINKKNYNLYSLTALNYDKILNPLK